MVTILVLSLLVVIVIQFFAMYFLYVLTLASPLPSSLGSANTWLVYHDKYCISVSSALEILCTNYLNFRSAGLSVQLMHIRAVLDI